MYFSCILFCHCHQAIKIVRGTMIEMIEEGG
jgi:hypothetical protein